MNDEASRMIPDLAWLEGPSGQRVARAAASLAARALKTWPARGRRLLEVNCATGDLQPVLRALGFDVTGCEGHPALRERFGEQLGSRYVVDPARADLLPYPDGAFDWVLLRLEYAQAPLVSQMLAEACRTAACGVAVTFWNRLSVPALMNRSLPCTPFLPWTIQRGLSTLALGRSRSSSALALPVRCWPLADEGPDEEKAPRRLLRQTLARLNGPLPRCLGALCLLTLEFPSSLPMTATPLRLRPLVFEDKHLACGERAYEGAPLSRGANRS